MLRSTPTSIVIVMFLIIAIAPTEVSGKPPPTVPNKAPREVITLLILEMQSLVKPVDKRIKEITKELELSDTLREEAKRLKKRLKEIKDIKIITNLDQLDQMEERKRLWIEERKRLGENTKGLTLSDLLKSESEERKRLRKRLDENTKELPLSYLLKSEIKELNNEKKDQGWIQSQAQLIISRERERVREGKNESEPDREFISLLLVFSLESRALPKDSARHETAFFLKRFSIERFYKKWSGTPPKYKVREMREELRIWNLKRLATRDSLSDRSDKLKVMRNKLKNWKK